MKERRKKKRKKEREKQTNKQTKRFLLKERKSYFFQTSVLPIF
jgi:hypothetical protein